MTTSASDVDHIEGAGLPSTIHSNINPEYKEWKEMEACEWRTQNEEHSGHLVAVLAKEHEGILGGGSLVAWLLEIARKKSRKLGGPTASEETCRGA